MNAVNKYEEDRFNLKNVLIKLSSRKTYYFITLFAGLVISFFIKRYAEPIYQIKSTILIRDEKNSSIGAENLLDGLVLFSGKRNIENEIGLIKSYSMVNETLRCLDFHISYFSVGEIRTVERYEEFPFKVILDTSHIQITDIPFNVEILSREKYKLTSKADNIELYDPKEGMGIKVKVSSHRISGEYFFGEPVTTDNFSFKIYLTEFQDLHAGDKLFFVIKNLNLLTEEYSHKLTVEQINKTSSILNLNVEGSVIKKEMKFLNKLCEVYIESGLEEKNRIATNTIRFIDEQLSGISDSLKNTESELESFRISNKVLDFNFISNSEYNKLEKFISVLILLPDS